MGFLSSIFGRAQPAPRDSQASRLQSQFAPSMSSQLSASQTSTRRELLRVVLRDTLQRHGIPTAWIGAEILASTSRTGERTVHWRLHIKQWEPRLLPHIVALQKALMLRVTNFDPMAPTWLSGISWQFMIEDDSVCPAMPHPGTWTAQPKAAPRAAAPVSDDIVIGTVNLGAPQTPTPDADAARADLNQLLAIRDADFRKHGAANTWASTEPAKI